MPLTLFDWTSSASGYVGAEMWLQLGGYYGTTHYFDGDALAWLPQNGEKPTGAAIVNIRPERCKVLVALSQAECETALAKFQECLDVFLWLVDKGFARLPDCPLATRRHKLSVAGEGRQVDVTWR